MVVVELKRTQDAGHAELQAIRYAAMVSTMTRDDLIAAHSKYFEKTLDQAKKDIDDHLASDTPKIKADRPRIIIASAGFSKELATSVFWLLQNFDLEIKCVELTLYDTGTERLLGTNKIFPFPQMDMVGIQRKIAQRREEQESGRGANFKLPMVGIEAGATLVFVDDANITCEVVDPENATVKYIDEGGETQVETLTDYTKRHKKTKDGRPYRSVQWSLYWRYGDKTLQQLRDQQRRDRFTFEMVGIEVGATLVLRDTNIECTVADGKTRVDYKKQPGALESVPTGRYALTTLANELGYLGGTTSWRYKGKTLQALRDELERESPRSAE